MKEIDSTIFDGGFNASQDITDYVEAAAAMRRAEQDNTTMRSFAIIPDIVSIDIHIKHRIDVHDDEQMQNPAVQKKLRRLIQLEYPYLLTGGITNRFSLGGGFNGN